MISEWDLAPYPGDQAPRHVHHGSDDAGTIHTFANRGPGQARILVVMTPEIDALITALHGEGADPAAIWARYNATVVS